MSEGAFSGEPVVPATPTSPEPGAQGSAESEAQGSAGRKVLFLAVGLLVIGIPLCVGILAFVNPPVAATEADASADGALADNSGSDTKSEDVAFADPLWTRPEWADAVEGMTAFELPAATDVLFGNGRLRPALGVTCSGEGMAVHIVTGGTALVDPQNIRSRGPPHLRRCQKAVPAMDGRRRHAGAVRAGSARNRLPDQAVDPTQFRVQSLHVRTDRRRVRPPGS